MNVRLSYGVELEKVPAKIAEMLQSPEKILGKNRNKLDLIVEVLYESDGKYAGTALEMIDDLRRDLALADQQLMEAQQILTGYMQASAPEPEVQTPTSLSDIPRGREAVRYQENNPTAAAGELPNLENNDV